jgi:hypothetical protein
MLAVPLLTSMGVSAATAGTMATIGGTLFSGLSMISQYRDGQALAKSQAAQGAYEQKLANQNAGQIEAQSQREALVAKRQGDLVASSAKAKLAGGGGQSSDPTAVNLVADIEARGYENQLNELYSGTSRANSVRQGGEMAAYQGRVNAASTKSAAKSALVGSAASLMTKYGGGGPGASTSREFSGQSSYYPNTNTWVDWYK